MSISTRGGDEGKTSLPGGKRVSKADPRIEWFGAIDELGAQIGFARSVCGDPEVKVWLERIQRELFKAAGAIAVRSGGTAAAIAPESIQVLDEHVRRLEPEEGMLRDWALPGVLPAAAALDVARTVCRRAERVAVRLSEDGAGVQPEALVYFNRLSDVLWLFARLLEVRANADGSLRGGRRRGPTQTPGE